MFIRQSQFFQFFPAGFRRYNQTAFDLTVDLQHDLDIIDLHGLCLGFRPALCMHAAVSVDDAMPEIPWREMYGLRNRIVHDYEGVNLMLVWEIITEDLPELEQVLQSIQ